MNLESLQEKLLAAAKTHPPADRVPLAFEKRVLAHLTIKPVIDPATFWSRALWQATVPCLALMLLLTSLALVPTGTTSAGANTMTTATEDLPAAFEQTLLASSDQFTSLDFLEDN